MLASLAFLGCLVLGQEGSSAAEKLQNEVSRLVRRLDDLQLADRDAAEQALLALGPTALGELPTVSDRMSAEKKQRLGRVRQKLQRAAAEASAATSKVTLAAKNMPLSELLAALERQSGNKIIDYRQKFGHPITDPKLNVDFQDTPFWQALDQVLDKADLAVYPFAEVRAIAIVGLAAGQLPRSVGVAYSGPFRFMPLAVTATRDLRLSSSESLILSTEVAWEPRIRPILLRQAMADLKAVDEKGNPVEVADPKAGIEAVAGDDTIAAKLELPLKMPPRSSREIASLKGKLLALLPGKVETFRFGNLTTAKNVPSRIAGVVVTLEEVRKSADLWEVRIGVRFDSAGEALQSHRGWIFKNEAYLEDAAGKAIAYSESEPTRQTENEVGMAYRFKLTEPPAGLKFIYKTPGLILPAEIDYELKGVKLP